MPGLGSSIGPTTGGWPSTIGRGLIDLLLAQRRYEATILVGSTRTCTTIAAGLSAVTTARAADTKNRDPATVRYRLLIDPGTYAEAVDLTAVSGQRFVDLVGRNRTTCIIATTNAAGGGVDADTIKAGGGNCLIQNLTIRQTTASGTYYYPIHGDGAGAADNAGDDAVSTSRVIVYNCTVEAAGANSKSGIGLGLFSGQYWYLIDSSFDSEKNAGIYAHNWNDSTKAHACGLFIVNCTGTSRGPANTGAGLYWINNGSGRASSYDVVIVRGGRFSGGASGTDIWIKNETVVYTGATETLFALDGAPTYTTLTAPAGQLYLLDAPIPGLPFEQPGAVVSSGTLKTGAAGMLLTYDGIMWTLRADKVLYIKNSDGTNIATMQLGQMKVPGTSGYLGIGANALAQYYGDNSAIQLKVNGAVALEVGQTGTAGTGPKLGFFGLATPIVKPTVSGVKSDSVAGSILAALVALGLVTDTTT